MQVSYPMNAEEILAELEAQMAEMAEFQGASFEQLEDYWPLADARLSVFRSERLWALVIEAVRYDAKVEEFNLDMWLYGNCLKPSETFTDCTRPLFRMPLSWQRQMDAWGFAREQFSILWRGQRHDFAPSLEEVEAAGVKLSRSERESGIFTPPQVLRYVCHALEHPFFAGEDTLRDLLDVRRFDSEWIYADEADNHRSWVQTPLGNFDEYPVLSCDLELFLQTRDWRHPRQGTMPEDAISVREAFEPLAQALANGDLTAWHAQDPARFNSHWSFWAETEWNTEQAFAAQKIELAAEGKRFQEYLTRFSSEEREVTLQSLKTQWETSMAKHNANLPTTFDACLISQEILEIEGQTFTFGPHLWGEEDDFPL